jgi:hypothetical protein
MGSATYSLKLGLLATWIGACVADPSPPAQQPTPVQQQPVLTATVAVAVDYDIRWQVTKAGTACRATLHSECPEPSNDGDPGCSPPNGTPYPFPAGWDGTSPLTVVLPANTTECVIDAPDRSSTPRKVACPLLIGR